MIYRYTWNSVNLLDSWGLQFFIRPKVLCQKKGHFSFQVNKSSFPTREKYQIAVVTWPGSLTSLVCKHLCVSICVPLFFGTLSSWKLSNKFISQRATMAFKLENIQMEISSTSQRNSTPPKSLLRIFHFLPSPIPPKFHRRPSPGADLLPSNLSPHPRATAFARQLPSTPCRVGDLWLVKVKVTTLKTKMTGRKITAFFSSKFSIGKSHLQSSGDVPTSHVSFPRGVYDALKIVCVSSKSMLRGIIKVFAK